LQDYNVLLFTRHHNHGRSQIYTNSMNSLLLADGSILMGAKPDRAELQRLHDEDYPFVFVGRREVSGREIDWVTHDYQTAATEAMHHLMTLGHCRVAFVSTGAHLEPQQDKLIGFQQAMSDRPDVELLAIQLADFESPDDCLDAIRRRQITALMCDDRLIFEEIMALLHKHEWRVPEQLSVISLTTANHSLPYTLEPTHLQLNQHRAGEVAARILVTRINREVDGPQQMVLPCRFVPGETTGAAPV
jgi:DNA-binding LacI/PurR family transcriptional regulator